ncbi:MAG TPA: hypothetical protein PL137_22225, partial [Nocardioides sp.]|nr:hypothetical protein [Nocardioides sp.]
ALTVTSQSGSTVRGVGELTGIHRRRNTMARSHLLKALQPARVSGRRGRGRGRGGRSNTGTHTGTGTGTGTRTHTRG